MKLKDVPNGARFYHQREGLHGVKACDAYQIVHDSSGRIRTVILGLFDRVEVL
jgi:hypothetical protein